MERLAGPVEPTMSIGAWGGKEYDTPETWRYNNYPGEWTTTQLMAYYNDAGGLYVACDDPKGLPKFLDPLLEKDGVALGSGALPGHARTQRNQNPLQRGWYSAVTGTRRGNLSRLGFPAALLLKENGPARGHSHVAGRILPWELPSR